MSESELSQIVTDIEDVLGFVTFGQERLNELSKHLKSLEAAAKSLASRVQAAKLVTNIALIRANLQTTHQSIHAWEAKGLSYQQQINARIDKLEANQQPIGRNIRQIDKTIKLLLKRISSQKHTLDVCAPQIDTLQAKINQRYFELLREKNR